LFPGFGVLPDPAPFSALFWSRLCVPSERDLFFLFLAPNASSSFFLRLGYFRHLPPPEETPPAVTPVRLHSLVLFSLWNDVFLPFRFDLPSSSVCKVSFAWTRPSRLPISFLDLSPTSPIYPCFVFSGSPPPPVLFRSCSGLISLFFFKLAGTCGFSLPVFFSLCFSSPAPFDLTLTVSQLLEARRRFLLLFFPTTKLLLIDLSSSTEPFLLLAILPSPSLIEGMVL